MARTIYPERIPRDVSLVVNTHLHFDHCGGNHLFAGLPIHVQRVEREAARESSSPATWRTGGRTSTRRVPRSVALKPSRVWLPHETAPRDA